MASHCLLCGYWTRMMGYPQYGCAGSHTLSECPQRRPMLPMKLTVFDDGVQSDLDLDLAVITIGRAKDNAVRLSNTRVSRHHARIESQGGAPWILDLGSANGIEVNGESVDRCILRSGDEVSLGLGVRLVLGDDVPGGEQQETEEEVGMRTLTGEAYREWPHCRH